MSSPRSDLTLVHHSDERGVWASHGRSILHARSNEGPWQQISRFPTRLPSDLLALRRLPRRLLRADKCNLRPTRSGLLLGVRGSVVYRIAPDGAAPPVEIGRIAGDCVMNRAMAEDADGNIYFGEYFMNDARVPVHVWRVDPELQRCECVYRFEKPRPRHVHAILSDPHEPSRLWITMGDFEDECYIAYTEDRFESVHFLGDGKQLWRAVGLLFEQDRIHWLTDTHIAQNHIVSMDRNDFQADIHGERPASSWYAARTVEGIHLATTTVEPGPCIRTDRAFLLASHNAIKWIEVASFAKDRFPMRGFGFGSLALPSGDLSVEGFWLSGEGLEGLDGRSVLCRLDASA
jgi:hypothetical protein